MVCYFDFFLMKLRLLIVFMVVTGCVLAQPNKQRVPNLPGFDAKPIHFGFYIGFNMMDFHVTHKDPSTLGDVEPRYAEVTALNPGINLGMVSSFRLNKYLNIRLLPGISFGQRDLQFVDAYGVQDDDVLTIKSTYLECPMLLKFSGDRMTNAKPFFIAGINPRYDLAKSKNDGIAIRPFDTYLEIGAGFDSYMTYFRFSTEFKFSVGLRNILDPDGTGEPEDVLYTEVLDKITSRIFVLTFYFE
jgi:hypothetical protein